MVCVWLRIRRTSSSSTMPAYICTSDFPQRIGTGARHTFYLSIPGKGYWDGQKYKCVIKGDNTEAYTLLETLRHGSIVVKDSQQRCFRVSPRGKKEYIGHEAVDSRGRRYYRISTKLIVDKLLIKKILNKYL